MSSNWQKFFQIKSFRRIKKSRGPLPRQPGRLCSRPVAFRPHLALGLAFSALFLLNLIIKLIKILLKSIGKNTFYYFSSGIRPSGALFDVPMIQQRPINRKTINPFFT